MVGIRVQYLQYPSKASSNETDLMGDAQKEGLLVGGVEEKVVDAGHWVMYEKPDEIAENIRGWLVKNKFTS